MDRLKGKRALITDGTSGIGLETAHQSLKEGARQNPGDSGSGAQRSRRRRTDYCVRRERRIGAEGSCGDTAAGVRPFLCEQRERAVLPDSGAAAGVRESGFHCDQRLSERAHRHAEHERLRSYQGGDLITHPHALRRTDLAWYLVNAVSPGPISTLVWQAGLAGSQVPAGRFGTPSEIAQAVVFLASDESAFTVGSELLVDGGMSL